MLRNISLTSAEFDTPLGKLVVVADEAAIYFLEFNDSLGFQRRFARFKRKIGNQTITSGSTPAIRAIQNELKEYFAGQLKAFHTPIILLGTPFQKNVWQALSQIPYGQTCSYAGLAEKVGNPLACRAVANANATNHIAIVVPCHRVIQANGQLGGYGGGQHRKQFLLDIEGV